MLSSRCVYLLVLYVLFHLLSFNEAACNFKGSNIEIVTVGATILDRLACLRQIGLARPKRICPKDGFEVVGTAYGATGNIIIAIMNALWLSEPSALNATILLPSFMQTIFTQFNNGSLLERFCITDDASQVNVRYSMDDKQLFYINQLFSRNSLNIQLKYSYEAVQSGATIWVQALSLLWSDPQTDIIDAAVWLIENKFNGSFQYTTLHKRSLEGRCPKIMNHSSLDIFSPSEFPMDHPSWRDFVELNKTHPICSMTLDFFQAIQKLNNRANQPIFLMHDGQEAFKEFESHSHGVILSSYIDTRLFPMFKTLQSRLYLDMFMAILGDFFVMNSLSTFSWSIFVVREALGIKTVPTYNPKYSRNYKDSKEFRQSNKTAWVEAYDIVKASLEIHHQLAL
jgi:hypothetical protein